MYKIPTMAVQKRVLHYYMKTRVCVCVCVLSAETLLSVSLCVSQFQLPACLLSVMLVTKYNADYTFKHAFDVL